MNQYQMGNETKSHKDSDTIFSIFRIKCSILKKNPIYLQHNLENTCQNPFLLRLHINENGNY